MTSTAVLLAGLRAPSFATSLLGQTAVAVATVKLTLSDAQVISAEEARRRFVARYRHRPGGAIDITPEMDRFEYFENLRRLFEKILLAADKGRGWVNFPRRDRSIYILTPLGVSLWIACKSYRPDLISPCNGYDMDPRLTLMLSAISKWREKLRRCAIEGKLDAREHTVRRALGDVFGFIVGSSKTKAFTDSVKSFDAKASDNFRSCCVYMRDFLDSTPSLMIVRVALYYLQAAEKWSETDDAAKAYDLFLRALRERRIVPDVEGWISKRIDGVEHGVRYELMVVFDGQNKSDPVCVAQIIGEYWKDRCAGTKSKLVQPVGGYLNYYVGYSQTKFNLLGLVHRGDRRALVAVRESLRFMTARNHQQKIGLIGQKYLRKGFLGRAANSRSPANASRGEIAVINSVFGR